MSIEIKIDILYVLINVLNFLTKMNTTKFIKLINIYNISTQSIFFKFSLNNINFKSVL